MAQQITVALLDDNPAVRTAIKRFLKGAGYVVHTFASSDEFLLAAPTFAADCLVLDVDLGPGSTSGLELAKHPLVKAMRVPIVVITGSSDEAPREQAAALGCFAYLRKPFPSDDLLDAVARAVERPSAES